jgi:hypothetical protein
MDTSTQRSYSALFATALLVAPLAMLMGCHPVVTKANAQPIMAMPSSASVYFGEEYATVEAALTLDLSPDPQGF